MPFQNRMMMLVAFMQAQTAQICRDRGAIHRQCWIF